jgi:hypothetical protein
MRKVDFEAKLIVGIASKRLSLLAELDNRNLYYSAQMYDPEDPQKVYLLELREDYFILRFDLIFDSSVERFFYVTKERYEYNEENLKEALFILQKTERKVYEILSRSKLRGFYNKSDFVRRLTQIVPRLDWVGNIVRDRKSGTAFITIKEDELRLVYKDGKSSSYMDIAKKDLNEKILAQCVEIIKSALKCIDS